MLKKYKMKNNKEINKRLTFSKGRSKELHIKIIGLRDDQRSFVYESYRLSEINAQIDILKWILRSNKVCEKDIIFNYEMFLDRHQNKKDLNQTIESYLN